MSDGTESYLGWIFSVGPDYFLPKIDILGLVKLIKLYGEISSSIVVDLCLFLHVMSCLEQQLPLNSFWATLGIIKKKITDDSLTVSENIYLIL